MQNMYPGKVNSPQTELAQAIDDEQTTIPLLDASVLPDPPNLATIGTGENAETVLYEGIDGNDLIDVTRGFQGAAKAWSAGVKVARLFTAYDLEAVQQNILSHASRHASGGPDEITPEMIGAETPAGAQAKADQAETNAKEYADDNFLRVIRLPHNNMGSAEYVKIAELLTDIGSSHNSLILHVNGTSDFGNNTPGSDVVQVSTRGGVGLRAYTFLPQGTEDIRYGYVNNSTTGKTEIWLRRDPWCQATQIIVAQATNVINLGILHQQTTEPSGITYVNKDAFIMRSGADIFGPFSAVGYDLPNSISPSSDLAVIAEGRHYFARIIDKTGYPQNNGSVIGYKYSPNNYQYSWQIFHGSVSQKIYRRYAISSTQWSAWEEVITSAGGQTINGNLTATGAINSTSGPVKIVNTTIATGANSPEGVVTAPVGSLFLRTNGGASTTLYVKESGTGNTGWKAVQTV